MDSIELSCGKILLGIIQKVPSSDVALTVHLTLWSGAMHMRH